MDSFIGLAKKGYEAYSESQSDVSKTGGQEYNSPDNGRSNNINNNNNYDNNNSNNNNSNNNNSNNYQQGNSGNSGRPSFNQDEVVQNAQREGSGESSLFSSALGFLNNNQSAHEQPVDEEGVQKAHHEAYSKDNAGSMSASSMGAAAALQAMKKFTGGGSDSSSSGSQSQLISLAMAEATKLFDKSGGAASGNKQDAVNGAAMTVMKLLVQSKFSGTTGGSNSGGLGSLLSLASKFA